MLEMSYKTPTGARMTENQVEVACVSKHEWPESMNDQRARMTREHKISSKFQHQKLPEEQNNKKSTYSHLFYHLFLTLP